MKWFEVTVLASASVTVQADDEDEATAFAYMEAFADFNGHKETKPAKLLESNEEVERMRRHADVDLPT